MRVESKTWRILATIAMIVVMLVPTAAASARTTEASDAKATTATVSPKKKPQLSSIWQFKAQQSASTSTHTDCPQAGVNDGQAPADRIEALSDDGDDIRVNQDLSCRPQNETSLDINPTNQSNIVAGANDYRLNFGSSGFYTSFDAGRTWRDGILPFPTVPPEYGVLDAGGDPAIAFDRQGYVYYANINFKRDDDTNGMFVHRSSNGGRTWSVPCVPIDVTPTIPNDDRAVCGGFGDPRKPGDGVLSFIGDNNDEPDGSVPFNDKEYIAAGPRPAGVTPQCFAPITKRVVACRTGTVGVDRIYVTWTLFGTFTSPATFYARIVMSYSDDRGLSWSPPKNISGFAPFCIDVFTGASPAACTLNQFSVPTVHPRTGHLYVAWENFNTPHENQYVVRRSTNGGQTFVAPRFIGSVFDVNYPYAGSDPTTDPGNRPDCNKREQFGRDVLTNSCFRVNSAGNIVVDPRGGTYANDLYVVISDNREGTPRKSNTNVYLFKSTNGGDNWTRPTRVNNDVSELTGFRDDPRNAQVRGNDQWFPWVDINEAGHLNVVFYDRRLDRDSIRHEYPNGAAIDSRQFPGNYLTWFWGAQCQVGAGTDQQGTTGGTCVVDARLLPQPTAPVNPGPGRVAPQGQTRFPFRNFVISDVPSNMDYAFRAGLFIGDYNNVALSRVSATQQQQVVGRAYGFWTDARNGRSSRNQQWRNPPCEQSDVYIDRYPSIGAVSDTGARESDAWFLKANCP